MSYLDPAPPLDWAAERALAGLHEGLHLGLRSADYWLIACQADGPIGPEPGESRSEDRGRHIFHARRWRMEGPDLWSSISQTWPEIYCTAREAERIAGALQKAYTAGRAAKAAELRAVMGLK